MFYEKAPNQWKYEPFHYKGQIDFCQKPEQFIAESYSELALKGRQPGSILYFLKIGLKKVFKRPIIAHSPDLL